MHSRPRLSLPLALDADEWKKPLHRLGTEVVVLLQLDESTQSIEHFNTRNSYSINIYVGTAQLFLEKGGVYESAMPSLCFFAGLISPRPDS